MNAIISRISSYNILNNIVPGAILYLMMRLYWGIEVQDINVIERALLYYFLGMVVSRIGSIFVEPICKRIKWIEYVDYEVFIAASKKDKKIDEISETNNLYRTMLAVFLVLLIGKGFIGICKSVSCIDSNKKEIIAVVLFILFAVSYKKQTNYLNKRVNKNQKGE